MTAITKKEKIMLSSVIKKWVISNITSILMVAAVMSSLATYYVISSSSSPADPKTTQVLGFLIVNIILLLTLAVFIANKITSLWLARKRESVGSRLQSRIIIMFSLVSIVPTSIVAVFSISYSIFVIDGWFSDRVGVALHESAKVAEGYVEEHRERINSDALTIANYLNSQYARFKLDPKSFGRDVSTQARILAINEAMVFRKSDVSGFGKNKVLAKSPLSFALENQISYLKEKHPEFLQRADDGEVVAYIPPRDENSKTDRILSLLRLYRFDDAYLLVGRFVNGTVIHHMKTSKGAAHEYGLIKSRMTDQQVYFGIIFVVVALLLLLAALWLGMSFASQLVNPISSLIKATERVKAGDLDTRVEDGPKDDEIGTLGRAFNRMTDQLQKHNKDMMDVNRIIDARRRLIEDVLSGVTAGIIALDSKRTIKLFNRTVPELLSVDKTTLEGKLISEIFPEVEELLQKVVDSPEKMLQEELSIMRDGRRTAFLVRVVREEFSDEIEGYIVTFDDITELQSAQRSAAWEDVARRIAHEIKNPLTPIHLSTERLRKKYGENLEGDEAEAFNRYLDTIVRHVGNIGKIVDEFASFARMPSPAIKQENIISLIREAITSQELVYEDVEFKLSAQKDGKKYLPVMVNGDAGQIAQVLTNLLKNAAESLEERDIDKKWIEIEVEQGDYIDVKINDNGVGFPDELLNSITEPYVTTKEKGTGLGLAIVKKVMMDHEGRLQIFNRKDKKDNIIGAQVVLRFPLVG